MEEERSHLVKGIAHRFGVRWKERWTQRRARDGNRRIIV